MKNPQFDSAAFEACMAWAESASVSNRLRKSKFYKTIFEDRLLSTDKVGSFSSNGD